MSTRKPTEVLSQSAQKQSKFTLTETQGIELVSRKLSRKSMYNILRLYQARKLEEKGHFL